MGTASIKAPMHIITVLTSHGRSLKDKLATNKDSDPGRALIKSTTKFDDPGSILFAIRKKIPVSASILFEYTPSTECCVRNSFIRKLCYLGRSDIDGHFIRVIGSDPCKTEYIVVFSGSKCHPPFMGRNERGHVSHRVIGS